MAIFVKRRLPDAFDLHQLIHVAKSSYLGAMPDDALRRIHPNPLQCQKIARGRCIDIHALAKFLDGPLLIFHRLIGANSIGVAVISCRVHLGKARQRRRHP